MFYPFFMSSPHLSVLLPAVVEAFSQVCLNTFVDGTLGAGGHSAALLEAYPAIERLIGIDQDPTALEVAAKRLDPWKNKVSLCHNNFANLDSVLDNYGIGTVDGILLDLGVSSMQFDMAEKGFSFMREGPLDMRMNPSQPLNAADVINTYSERDLGRIFREYGEESQWRAAAQTIVASRKEKPILTTFDLVNILKPIFSWKKKGINPLTLIFQGLRIYVNSELDRLNAVIPKAIDRLSVGGRLAIISFHSLEDRIVKNQFRAAASDKEDDSGFGDGTFIDKIPTVKILTRKPLTPSEEEIVRNPRSRSAKLRVVEKR